MAFGFTRIRTLTRQHWHPKTVWLEHESLADISEHQRILGSPLFFNQPVNPIAMERGLLEQKIPLADRGLLPILEQHLQILLAQQEVDSELVASVGQMIAPSCH